MKLTINKTEKLIITNPDAVCDLIIFINAFGDLEAREEMK